MRPKVTSRGQPCGIMRVLESFEGCKGPRNYRKPREIGYITSIIGLFPAIMSFASLNIMKTNMELILTWNTDSTHIHVACY